MKSGGDGDRLRGKAVKLTVLVVLLVLLIFFYLSWVEYKASPKLFGEIDPCQPPPDAYKLSANQSSILSQIGHPDSFQILFFGGESNGNRVEVRLETWTYYSLGREISFLDGEMISDEVVEDEIGSPIEIPYRPEQFAAFMNLEEIIVAAGIEEYLVVPMEPGLVKGGEIIYAEELAFGLRDGELLYVETMPAYEEVSS
ncbi:MAG: hypothetical protein HXS50_04295 [Theionarchaea archaeon]|nr:hypothetical protein [Theionarchaea archaeon]